MLGIEEMTPVGPVVCEMWWFVPIALPCFVIASALHGPNAKQQCLVCRVRKQVVNIPSYIVRLDSQKHIDFSLRSPYGGGRPGKLLIQCVH